MKKIVVIIIIIICLLFYLMVLKINSNSKYEQELLNSITKNYKIENKIISYKLDKDKYLITTSDDIIVLNDKYEEVLKIALNTICDKYHNYEFSYKNNNLFLLEKTVQNKSITYKYYNIYNCEQEKETTIGG